MLRKRSATWLRALLPAVALVALMAMECDPSPGGDPEIGLLAGSRSLLGDGSEDYGFGDVAVGSSLAATFSIENRGTGDLTLTGSPFVRVSGDGPFTVTASPEQTVLPAGETSFSLTFTPAAEGEATTSVEIESNDPNEPVFRFTVSGSGVAAGSPEPEIAVLVGTTVVVGDGSEGYDFGGASVGETISTTFTLANDGEADLLLTGTPFVAVSGGEGAFAVSAQPDGATLGAGEAGSFTISFTPAAPGEAGATITIASNDTDEPSFSFGVTGAGDPYESGEISIALSGASAAEGMTVYAAAMNVGESIYYVGWAVIADGAATLTLADSGSNTTVPGGTELDVGLFVDVNGDSPSWGSESLTIFWPDYGDEIAVWPSAGGTTASVVIDGDLDLSLGSGDYVTMTDRLVHVTLTNGPDDAETGSLQGKTVYLSLFHPDLPAPENDALAGASVTLDEGVLVEGQTEVLFDLSTLLPYGIPPENLDISYTLYVLVDTDGSYAEEDPDAALSFGDYFTSLTVTPSALEPGEEDIFVLPLEIGADVPEYGTEA